MKKLISKTIISLGVIVFLFALSVASVRADGAYGEGETSVCVPVYGGGEECPRVGEVLIDKKVRNPRTGIFVDNILPNDPTRYRPKEVVTFQIILKNSGETTFDKVVVKDTVPSFLDYMSVEPVSDASYDANTRVLTFSFDNLQAGETRVFTLKARVVHVAALPEGKDIICPVNIVTAETDGKIDRDESQVCIEKEMEQVPAVPEAGPASWALTLFGLSSSMLAGLKLRKKV